MISRFVRRFQLALPLAALAFASSVANAQRGGGQQQAAFNISPNPVLSSFRFRGIGPASMGGRIDDIQVSESDPNVIYIGYAVGGVFKSTNNGTSFEPVFQSQGSASIGAVAIHPTNPDVVYVGTGEANNRQSASFGDGLYKTTDGGKTWTNLGLKETQSIARIVIDPRNPEIVYVAAVGHLFGPNKERGIYKTTDGGKTWALVKFIDEDTGFTDLVMDPTNSNTLYAASYQRRRTPVWMNGGGPGSGIWKSENAGATWTKLTNLGVPGDLTMGRIALGMSRSSSSTIYAQIQVGQSNTPEVAGGGRGGRGGGGGRGGRGAGAGGAPGGGAPVSTEVTPPGAAQRASDSVSAVKAGATPVQAGLIAAGIANAGRGGGGGGGGYSESDNGNVGACNAGAPNARGATAAAPDPKEGGVYRSDDKGRTWRLVNNCDSRPMYFSQLRVDPSTTNTLYVGGLPWAKSTDGGKTFATLDAAGGNGEPAHVDQHAMWIDPRNPKHIMIGNDGGLDITWDQGKSWDYVNTMATSLAYWVTADMRRPYWVYTGLQDNGSWGGPSSKRSGAIYNSDWFGVGGGDGFQTAVNADAPWIVYTESQDGATTRYDLKDGGQRSIRPSSGGGGGRGGGGRTVLNSQPGDQYRFNWNTPFILSPHDPNIVWLGGNRLFKSVNRGDTWTASEDLTKNIDRRTVAVMGVPGDRTMISKSDGIVSFPTIIAVNESPVTPGLVWAGTDDGNLQVSQDGGRTFTEVGKNIQGLPANHGYWFARIDPSHFDAATAYVAVDGHRSDDLKPYVFKTTDLGKTWTNITSNLPTYGNVQVVREDPKNPNLIYVGTEFGLFVSLDGGKSYEKFMNDYPTVRTDDILIHPRDGDLIVATHGRGIFIADDITALQQFTPAVQNSDAYLFDIRAGVNYIRDVTGNMKTGGQRGWSAPSAPGGVAISYYLKTAPAGPVTLTVTDACGLTVNLSAPKAAGINRVRFPAGGGGRGQGGGGGGFGGLPDFSTLTGAERDSAIAELIAAGGGFGGGFGGGGRGAAGAGGGCGSGAAGAGGRGGRGGGGGATPGWYTAKLSVNGKDYTKTFQIMEDKWASDPWAVDR